MTDEQWEIVNELRMLALGHGGLTCAKAANEIERLEQELSHRRISSALTSMSISRLSKEVARLKDENGVIREQCQNMLDMTVR